MPSWRTDQKHIWKTWAKLLLTAWHNNVKTCKTGKDNIEIESRLDTTVERLALAENVAQLAGKAILPSQGMRHTSGIERFGLPGYRMTDGTRGVSANKSKDGSALGSSQQAYRLR